MEDFEEVQEEEFLNSDEDFMPLDIEENDEEEADEIEVEREETPKVVVKASYDAKLRELFRNLYSAEVKIYSDASKEFIRLLGSDSGCEILYQYVQASPLCPELVEAWKIHQGKPGVVHVLSLISAFLDHPDGKYKSNDTGRLTISRRLDMFARSIIETKLRDVYAELNSKEARRQNAVLLLMGAIVRRGVGLASEVAKNFDFKHPVFPKLAEYQKNRVTKNGKYSTRRSFIEFALSFLEVGNPRLLRWVLQQKDMFSGILRGLGSDDEETVVYVLSTLRDRVLNPDSLVPPGLRSVLFGSVTLEQLVSISGSPVGGPSADIAHEVLVMVCTDPRNGLMPDLKGQSNPLKGNRKRLLDLMKKLKATDIGYHRDLLLAIVNGRPSFGSAYMDEIPYNLEPRSSPTWFVAISLVADLVSFTSTGFNFVSLASQKHDSPTLDSFEVQCMLKCIIPRAFSRVVINRGLQHDVLFVRHGCVRFLLEALKSLDNLISAIDFVSHPNNSVVNNWSGLKQDIQDEARALLPDPQVVYSLLNEKQKKGKEKNSDSQNLDKNLKRARSSERLPELHTQDGAKKLKTDLVDNDVDIIICGISTEPDNDMSKESKSIKDKVITEELDDERESVKVIAGIWGLQPCTVTGVEIKDAEIYLHSKVLDALTLYLRTVPIALEGSYDFFKKLPRDPFTLSVDQQQSLLSLLIESIGWSPRSRVPVKPPEEMYKHLPKFINLLIRSPIKSIQDQAYILARAAMFSTGAFDRNISEIDAWFLFLPGYRRQELPLDGQGVEVFGDLLGVVVSFLCDAVSTVGNNLYMNLDNVRSTLFKIKGTADVSLDFSPLIFCILDKCLRLLHSGTEKKLCDKSMISMYVCSTLSFLLQTQVRGGLLPAFIDFVLTEKLGDFSPAEDDSEEFLCEWRPLKNLLLFSRNISHEQACSSLCSITQRTSIPIHHPFVTTLGKIKEIIKNARGGAFVGVAAALCSSVICTTPNDILENFPTIITLSHHLLGKHLPFLSYLFFLDWNLLAGVADLWPDIFFSGLELVKVEVNRSSRTNSCSIEELISTREFSSIESASVAFSFLLKQVPFFLLFPSILGLGNSNLLVSTKLADVLQVKLSEGSPDDSIASLRLVLFWVHQIQLSYRVNPLDGMEQLLQTCFACIKHILAKLLVVKSDFGTLTSEALDLVPYIQEAAKIIFHHPAVILSLSRPLCCNKGPTNGSLCSSFEDFISSSKSNVHSVDHNILHSLTTVADYLLALCSDQCALSEVHDAANKQLLKDFKTMVQQVISSFRDKFALCIESKDMTSLLPTYNILHALIHYMSPFELLELVQRMFRKVVRAGSVGWKSSNVDAFSVGCYIAGGAFSLLSNYLYKVNGKTISSSLLWELKGQKFDVAILEEVYYKIIELATSFKLECADLCLLNAVDTVYRHKHMQPQTDALRPIMVMSRVIMSSPIKILSYCIQNTSVTKANFLFLLTEVSPLHLILFGQLFSSITGKHFPEGNMVEENCNCVLSDEELMMLLPVALSYLNFSITKFGVQYLKYLETIPSIYSRILLDGFLNWKSFVSGNIFQEEYGESVPLSTQGLLNLFSSSLLGKAIHMLRYYFALNADSVGKKKRKELFGSIYPFSGAKDELLDCDVSEINICSTNQLLNAIIRVMAKISFSRLLLFPEDNFIQSLKTETDEHLKVTPLRIGSNRKDTLKLRFMIILVTTLHKIVERFPQVADNSKKSKCPDEAQLFRFLEAFILRNILELSREMKTELVQLDSLPFLEPLFKSSLIYRFEDPATLKVLRGVLIFLSEGKYSSRVFFELLQAHSQFVPSILWSYSNSDSSNASHGGTLLKPISSILKSHVLLSSDLRGADDTISLEISPSYSRKLEVIKLFRVLYHLTVFQKNNITPEEDICMNSGELLSLLLSCYGATMSEVDLQIFNLMHEIVSIEGSDCSGIAEMDYLWGSAALKLKREKEFESSNDMTDGETSEERRRRQFRESFAIDQELCLATVLHFPYDRTACDGPTTLRTLQEDNFIDMLEEPSARIDRIQQYDPAFILSFSIHGLSMGYFEPLEFAGLGLLAVAIMGISSPDEGIRKLGYEALVRFKNVLEDHQNRKGGLRLRLLLTYLQNGITEECQKIPSVTAIFAAEASLVLLDPSHDHYFTISKLLLHTPKVNLKCIPLFHTLFESSSINFKTDRLWILRLSYAGLNLDDDASIFKRKYLLEMLSFYSSSLSDYESKTLILQIVKKSVKLPMLARYLVENCGLISWLSSVFCFCRQRLCDNDKDLFLKQMTVGLQVVGDVISQRTITELLQNYAFEQLSELSSHLYKFLFGSMKAIKQNLSLVNLILQILVTTLKVSQNRKRFQPHFNLSYESLFQLYQVIDDELGNTQSGPTAELVLRAMLMSAPPVVKMDREKLIKFVMLAIPVASMSYSEETLVLKKSEIQFETFSGEQPCEETLISTLLRWVTASVIVGRISKKSCKMNASSTESAEVYSLLLLLENLKKEQTEGSDDDCEGQKDDCSDDVALAASILYLQQLLGRNCKVLHSVVSALCLLLLSEDSYNTGGALSLTGDQGKQVASLCSKIRCPTEANSAWRWSFDHPWKDSSSELTDLQKVDEDHACQTLLLMFSNALRGKSLDLPALSYRDLEDSGVFAWERNILTTELGFK